MLRPAAPSAAWEGRRPSSDGRLGQSVAPHLSVVLAKSTRLDFVQVRLVARPDRLELGGVADTQAGGEVVKPGKRALLGG